MSSRTKWLSLFEATSAIFVKASRVATTPLSKPNCCSTASAASTVPPDVCAFQADLSLSSVSVNASAVVVATSHVPFSWLGLFTPAIVILLPTCSPCATLVDTVAILFSTVTPFISAEKLSSSMSSIVELSTSLVTILDSTLVISARLISSAASLIVLLSS